MISASNPFFCLPNVADQLHLLASGTRACRAGEVPEVRLGAQVLAESVCSACGLRRCGRTQMLNRGDPIHSDSKVAAPSLLALFLAPGRRVGAEY